MNTSNIIPAKMSETVIKLRNIVFFIFLMLTTFSHTILLHAQWVEQNSGVSTDLRDIFFVDSLFGWAVGDSGVIINTISGGDTWLRQNNNIDSVRLEKIFFVNRNVGYIVGRQGIILSTKDGGAIWNKNNSGVDFELMDLSFVDENTGWVAGGDFDGNRRTGVILKTTNGGENWKTQLEITTPNFFGSHLFTAVEFINNESGWACADDHVDNFSTTSIYKTTNGGVNWDIISETDISIWNMSISEGDTIWVCGIGFAKSSNGGLSWEYDYSGLGGNTLDIVMENGEKGWRSEAHLGESKIFYTENYWDTKEDILKGEKIYVSAMANIAQEYLWAVGDSGKIYRYKSPVTSIEQITSLPQHFLQQNFPNPFNSSTTISFSIPKRSFINLCVYDILGREVAALVNEERSAGVYETIFNANSLSSGVYFYQLRSVPVGRQAGEFVQTRKFVLQK